MPNDYQMRAPSTKERLGDFLRSVFGSIAEQPLGQIGDALGVTDFTGLAEPRSSEELNLGIMPGPPGSGFLTPKPKSVGTFSKEGMLSRKNVYRPSKREIDLEYESITNPEAARVAQKYGIDVAPTGEVDWFGPTHSKLAEQELDEIALRRAAAMGTEPRRLGRPNAIPTTEVDHFAPTLKSAPGQNKPLTVFGIPMTPRQAQVIVENEEFGRDWPEHAVRALARKYTPGSR